MVSAGEPFNHEVMSEKRGVSSQQVRKPTVKIESIVKPMAMFEVDIDGNS